MKFKHTLLFTGLFGAVLTLYVVQNQKQVEKKEVEHKTSESFVLKVEEKGFELGANEVINFLQVQNIDKDEAFWLELQDSKWRVVYPVQAEADQALAQGMAAMVKMASTQKLISPEGDWDEYGLKNPSMKIGVGTNAGADRHFLYLGKQAPLGNAIFARWDDKNAYFMLPAAVKEAFKKTAYEAREKRIFLLPLPKIDRVMISMGERTFEWVLRNNSWFWMEPLDLLGKPMADDQMSAVLQMVLSLNVKEFTEQDEEAGIASRGVSVIADRIQIRSGAQIESLYFGDEEPLKTAYYAKREKDKYLFLIDQAKVIALLDLLEALDKANHPPVATKMPVTDASPDDAVKAS